MADYKGGEIFIDLGGIDIETVSSSNTNIAKVSGIYSRLETAFNLGKRIVITNYHSKAGSNTAQKGIPLSVSLYRPTGAGAFIIPLLAESGISILQIVTTDAIRVTYKYAYHNIYTPPETTNNAKSLEETEIEETEIEETEKGEESK